ncbi:Septin-6 [Sparganum proliferum]
MLNKDNCIIIQGLPESSVSTARERVAADLEQFQKLLNEMLQPSEDVTVLKAFRLGSRTNAAPQTRARPLKIVSFSAEVQLSWAAPLVEPRCFMGGCGPVGPISEKMRKTADFSTHPRFRFIDIETLAGPSWAALSLLLNALVFNLGLRLDNDLFKKLALILDAASHCVAACLTSVAMAAEVAKHLGPECRTLKLNGRVGFDCLPDQLVEKSINQGFAFNILCVGETGLGKSTLIETLFNQKFDATPASHDSTEVKLKSTTYGHSLKSVDLVAMKKLENKVNIIPVIAKSDTITKAELLKFKARVISEIKASNIHLYEFPTDDEVVSEVNKSTNLLVPFAVVGSTEEAKINGRTLRVRQYPWGSVQVENEAHCDFVRLREMLLRVNMEDLRERTHVVHYETYRKQRLTEMGFRDDEKISLQETYEKRRELQRKELKQKEEEMRQMFVQRVKDKEQVLKESERELQAKFDSIKKQHAEEKKKLEEKRRILAEEMAAFERRKQLAEQAKQGNLTMKKKK